MAMLLPALVVLLLGPARAATIQLDTGATVEGDLAVYKLDGDCQISVTEGPLTGSILIVPCARVTRFERAPAPPTLVSVELPPLEAPTEAADAPLVTEEVEPMDVVPEPVAAPPSDASDALGPPPDPDAMPLALPLSQAPATPAEPEAEPAPEPAAEPEPEPEPTVVATRTTTARTATTRVPTATTDRTRGTVDLPALPPRLERFIYGDSRSDLGDEDDSGDDSTAPIFSASPPQAGANETHHDPGDPGTMEL
jgi:hypothetical protein